MDDLTSNQEEADTRIILHAIHAANRGANKIVVQSPDTDVLVLLLHHRPEIHAREIYFLTGHEGKHANLARYIPVHILYDKLSQVQHNVLLSVYCLTGCDTTSSFHGHGKRTAFRIMMQKADTLQALSTLGTGQVTKAERIACTQLVGLLYGKSECLSLNQLRADKAEQGTQPKKLPPTADSLLFT